MKLFWKRIGAGVLVAFSGAFAWALVSIAWTGRKSANDFMDWMAVPLWALYAVLVASWFLLPLGACLGLAMPSCVRRASRRGAFLKGALLGVGIVVLAASLTTTMATSSGGTIIDHEAWSREVLRRFIFNLTTMSLICSVWVGA